MGDRSSRSKNVSPQTRQQGPRLGFEYVLRIRGDIYVTGAKGERRLASDWVGVKGRSRTLRGATVSDTHALPVGTVVCVHAKAMKESWCVVASEEKIATRTLIRYYAKRWASRRAFATVHLSYTAACIQVMGKSHSTRDRD